MVTTPREIATPGRPWHDWPIVLGFTFLGALLRFWAFGRLGLTHFDEGVYALAGLWSVSPRGLAALDPQVIAYAPPGFPILIGLGYALFGVSDAPALLVAVVCGVLTIPAAGWVGRRTFGPGAGAAASAFAALSTAHVAFSRKALTDAPFLLCWVVALGLGGRYLERPRIGRAVAFGLAVGLAQNFKYSGWISGAVVILAASLGTVVSREERRLTTLLRTFGLLGGAALLAAGCYWPWYRFVEAHGGYADLVRHHRSYLGGTETWVPHWRQQLAQLIALSGGLYSGALAWTAAWIGAGLATNGLRLAATSSRWDLARLRLGWMLGAMLLGTIPDLPWWVGLAWTPVLLFDRLPASRALAASWLVLSLMTPFYHPYARLWLPLHAAGWIAVAGVIVRLGPFPGTALGDPSRRGLLRPRIVAQAAAVIACLALARTQWGVDVPRPFPSWFFSLPTDNLRVAVANLPVTSRLSLAPRASLRVFARRPVAFYLLLQGKYTVRLVPDRDAILAGPGDSGEYALVDEAVFGPGLLEGPSADAIAGRWSSPGGTGALLDPVTQLDVDPASAFEFHVFEKPALVLLTPLPARVPFPSSPNSRAEDEPK